ncbi:DUF397 domain-containing protein [Streptomyces noursei]|uniref:DUF397 domain-containing protein n=1 Tax=Streptomyces noursei TaxID=1971 RepID=UPI00167AF1D6|nr:DUF397 domain-containing protein [Streptomyces noursei]MCZ1018547.1 DUF397 domain-containing protein [Streptomyces noursei]GGX50370.1 hypothetical protein GCM10010341_85040 [Streptomyces noursei]
MNTGETSPARPELAWFKSSYSGAEGGQCVEVAATADSVNVRDSKRRHEGPTLTVGREAWAGFIGMASGTQA